MRTTVAAAVLALTLALVVPCLAQEEGDAPAAQVVEFKETGSGLKFKVLKDGTGTAKPEMGDPVKVHYRGWLDDGTEFDSSYARGQPAEFQVGGLIAGWNEALQLMTVGAKWELLIPPELGYGASQSGKIPPNSTLHFELELLSVTKMPKFSAPDPAAQKSTASGLKYEVVKAGAGDPITADKAFRARFALFTTGGKLVDCSERTGGHLKGIVGGQPYDFLKEGLQLMCKGAHFRFEVPASLAFGEQRMGPIAPNSVTIWEIEVEEVFDPAKFVMPAEDELTKTESGLAYMAVSQGEGEHPKATDVVTVHYTGWLTDGTQFDSSAGGDPVTFPLNRVIAGWTEGLQLMKPGATYVFVIPPGLAYGARQMGPIIKPNSTLVFRVELVKIGN